MCKVNGEKCFGVVYYNYLLGKVGIGVSYLNVVELLFEMFECLVVEGYDFGDWFWDLVLFFVVLLVEGCNVVGFVFGEFEDIVVVGSVVRVLMKCYC